MRERLERAGINRVNAVVDITNVVMLEQGQPLHAFDADVLEQLTGQPVDAACFGLRQARDGEVFIGLDERKLALDPRAQVVTCHDRPIALAGVMGSRESGVTDATRRIWLESAVFTPSCVRETARSVGLRTDASARFEKGLPKDLTLACSVRAVELLEDLFSCRVAGRWVCGDVSADSQPVLLRRAALQRLLGSLESPEEIRSLDDQEIEGCLTALGCELTPVDAGWQVIAPPSRRQDLSREVDLIEEVARLVGFDRFGSHLPDPIVPGRMTPIQQAERRLLRVDAGGGGHRLRRDLPRLYLVAGDDAHRVGHRAVGVE